MGKEQSTLNESNPGGYHVINVECHSIAEKLHIEPYFDFVIGINEYPLTANIDLTQILTPELKNTPMDLVVKNTRDMDIRRVSLPIPWESLGLTLRFCNTNLANKHVFHVTRVDAEGPASKAGLLSDQDYIFYAKDYKCFDDIDSFFDLVKASKDKSITLGIFNVESNTWREVKVAPSDSWGGGSKGLLGCDIGVGITHRIPPRSIDKRPPGKRQDIGDQF